MKEVDVYKVCGVIFIVYLIINGLSSFFLGRALLPSLTLGSGRGLPMPFLLLLFVHVFYVWESNFKELLMRTVPAFFLTALYVLVVIFCKFNVVFIVFSKVLFFALLLFRVKKWKMHFTIISLLACIHSVLFLVVPSFSMIFGLVLVFVSSSYLNLILKETTPELLKELENKKIGFLEKFNIRH